MKRYKHKPPVANMYKILANALYGRTIMNDRKYATNTRLIGPKQVGKHTSHPKFKKIRQIGKDTFYFTTGL